MITSSPESQPSLKCLSENETRNGSHSYSGLFRNLFIRFWLRIKLKNKSVLRSVKIDSLKQQFMLLAKPRERANYIDESNKEINNFAVFDPHSIWLDKASGFGFQLLDALPISVFVKDRASRYTYLNAKARDMMGFEKQVVIGRVDEEVLKDKKNIATYRKEDKYVMDMKDKRAISEPWNTESGEYVIHETTRFPILDAKLPSRVIGVVSIAEDITWIQKAQVGREIVSMINHDWITDILRGLYIRHSSDEDISRYADLYDFVIEYLENLSFYFAGEFDPKKFEKGLKKNCHIVNDVLKPMINFVDHYRQGDPYYTLPIIETTIDELRVNCNKALLKIMVYQQIRNHYENGRSKTNLLITVEPVDKGKGCIIDFKSPGEPIPQEIVQKFGEPHFKKSEELSNDSHLKLGLYLCKRIAILHHGEVKDYYYDQKLGANCFRYLVMGIGH